MDTAYEFDHAPTGATATSPDGSIAFKTGRLKFEWSVYDSHGLHCDNLRSDEMGGFTLNPALSPIPGTASGALDLAWNLAHPLKEGQHIPEGTRLLERSGSNDFSAYTTLENITINARESLTTRTLDPLPEPEPEVREHPVTIYHGDRKVGVGRFVWHPGGASIVDVEPCKSDTLHDPLRYRAYSFRYDKPWGTKLGGDPA